MKRCRECKRLLPLKRFKKRGSWYALTCTECIEKSRRPVELASTPARVKIRICRAGGYHRVYVREGEGWKEVFWSVKKEEALAVLCKWFGT